MGTRSDTFSIGGDLAVNRLGFGAMRITGERIIGEPDDPEEARAVLRRAVELGVDFIDTADSYGPGVSERLVGEAVPEDEAVVATKGGLLRNRQGDWLAHGDPDYLRNAALCSLDRLRTDCIDLYQFHRPDPDVPFEESVRALADLKDAGLVEHVGLSNVGVEQLERARDIVEVATVQNQYNVANREHEDVLAACEDAGIGFIPYFPVGAGALEDPAVRSVAEEHDATVYQVALAWLLEHSPVTLPIPGTGSVAHLEENVAAADLELDEAAMAELDSVDG
jgi:aryl-alcohol dehydrogenase-like predicted oxidoreductase